MADETLKRDQNHVTVLAGVTDDVNQYITMLRVDPDTKRLKISGTITGGGTVSDVSVVSANGFAGSVATSTTTPAITLSTTVTGILSGNGTAISAASTTGSGAVVLATSPTLVTPVLGVASATSLTIGGTGNSLVVDTSTLVVDATNNRVGFGTADLANPLTAETRVQFVDADGGNSDWSFKVAGGGFGVVNFAESRGTTGTPLVSTSGDTLGAVVFLGYDGANFIEAADIRGFVNGSPGTNDMPGGIRFRTTPDASASLATAVEILNDKSLKLYGQLNANGQTILNTGTLTLPTSTDTLVGRATTDTLTNKTLTSPSIATPTITSEWDFGANTAGFTETDNGNSGTSDTIDWRVSNKQKSTLTGNVTYTFTAPTKPCNLVLKVLTGAGSFTATWPATVKWSGGVAPTITTTASRADIICFYYDGTNYYGSFSLNYTP